MDLESISERSASSTLAQPTGEESWLRGSHLLRSESFAPTTAVKEHGQLVLAIVPWQHSDS